MRRAFPQKVKPVSCDPSGSEAVLEQPKQSSQGINRKARTSAAMLGLALSMGASSLLIPRHDDRASAAEPRLAGSELRTASPDFESISLEPAAELSASKVKPASAWVGETFSHRVSQGQTLRSIARQYRVSLRSLASANGITPDAIIQMGQTIQIPASPAALSALRESRSVASLPRLARSSSASDGLKSPQADSAPNVVSETAPRSLSRLRLQREQLRGSLAGLRSDGSSSVDNGSDKAITPLSISGLSTETSANPAQRSGSEIADSAPSEPSTLYHVKPGDTLGAIARAYDVPQRVLQAVNQLDDPNMLQVNQPLVVPETEVASAVPDNAATAVSPGLAASQGVTTSSNFTSAAVSPQSAEQTIAYRVTFGDTLAQIAQENGVSKETLIQANRISNPDFIRVGQVLQVPDSISIASVPTVSNAGTDTASVEARSFSTQSGETLNPSVAVLPTSALVSVPTVPAAPELTTSGAAQPAGVAMFSTEFVSVEQAHTVPLTTPQVVYPQQTPVSQPASAANQRSFSHLQRLMEDVASMRRYVEARPVESKAVSDQPAMADAQSPLTVAAAPQNPTVPASDVLQSFDSVGGSIPASAPASEEQARVEAPAVTPAPDGQAAQVPQSTSPADNEAPQLVATASLGSENYSPLLEPLVGRMVSPELPALAGADAFLPQGSATFNGYIWPARGVLTSGYGWRWGRMHRGIDVAAPVGTPVVAAAAGVVQYSGWNSGGYGYMVDIRHPDGSMTRYGHNSRLLVRVGQEVAQGEQIAAMGSTGYSTGPHVHFEVHLPNQGAVNPATYLARR